MSLRHLALSLASLATLIPGLAADPARPNIVLIIADDLGWGDVGFQGQTKIRTPNLDKLAAQSLRFSDAHAPAPVCAPTRAAMLTSFHTGHAFVDWNGDIDRGFRKEDVLVSTRLTEAGYATGAFGKWGFGTSKDDAIISPQALPAPHGFREFYGLLSHGVAHNYRPAQLWRNDPAAPDGVRAEPFISAYSHDAIAEGVVEFIRRHARDQTPFFLYVPFTIPHFDLDEIAKVPGYFDAYAEVPGAEKWPAKAKNYAAMITRMDASIGALLAALDDGGIARNTVVAFTSDNGPTAEDGAPIQFFDSNGPFRGGKRDLWEGGIRVPLIVRWPARTAPGVSDQVVDLVDLAPTFAEMAGTRMPPGHDGVSLLPLLTGKARTHARPYLVFENHEGGGPDPDPRNPRWAVRRGSHKLIKFSDDTTLLYDLARDPGENAPITDEHIQAELIQIAQEEQLEAANTVAVQYITWAGGRLGDFSLGTNWKPAGAPTELSSAVLRNTEATIKGPAAVLGLEVGAAKLELAEGAVLRARNELRIITGGRVILKTAAISTARWVEVQAGGVLEGSGTIEGDCRLLSGSVLKVTLGSPLKISGKLVAGGKLQVAPPENFTPKAGDEFQVLAAKEVTGNFEAVLPELPGELTWDSSKLAAEGKLMVLDKKR